MADRPPSGLNAVTDVQNFAETGQTKWHKALRDGKNTDG